MNTWYSNGSHLRLFIPRCCRQCRPKDMILRHCHFRFSPSLTLPLMQPSPIRPQPIRQSPSPEEGPVLPQPPIPPPSHQPMPISPSLQPLIVQLSPLPLQLPAAQAVTTFPQTITPTLLLNSSLRPSSAHLPVYEPPRSDPRQKLCEGLLSIFGVCL